MSKRFSNSGISERFGNGRFLDSSKPFNPLTYNDPNGSELVSFWYSKTAEATDTQVIDAMGDETRPVQAGRCYNFDGVDDYVLAGFAPSLITNGTIEFTIKTADTSGMFMSDEGGSGTYYLGPFVQGSSVTNLSQNSGNPIFYIDNVLLTPLTRGGLHNAIADGDFHTVKITNVNMSSYPTKLMFMRYFGGSFVTSGKVYDWKFDFNSDGNWDCIYKMDESTGTVAFDSSGNGNHGTITNATLSSFHATDIDIPYSWQNDEGYSEGVNLLKYSEQFDNAAWVKTANTLVLANQSVAPDGSNTADLVYPTVTGEFRGAYQTISGLGATAATFSIWAKSAGHSFLGVVRFSGSGVACRVNLTDGSISGVAGGYTATSEADGGGYWVHVTGVLPVGTAYIQVYVSDGADTNIATASGNSGIYVWGAQLEESTTATAYQKTEASPTAGALIPRNEAIPTQDVLGNPLQYQGRVKYNLNMVGSSCANFDGVNDYGDLSEAIVLNMANDFTVSYYVEGLVSDNTKNIVLGDSANNNSFIGFHVSTYLRVNTVQGGIIDFTGFGTNTYTTCKFEYVKTGSNITCNVYSLSGVLLATQTKSINTTHTVTLNRVSGRASDFRLTGKLYNIYINNNGVETHYPIAEGKGTRSYAKNDKTKYIDWKNVTESTFWGTQDTYHSNLTEDGYSEGVNLLKYSEQFNNAAWGKSFGGVGVAPIVTGNAAIAPNGTMTADLVSFDCGNTSTAANRSYLVQGVSVTVGSAYRGDLYVKAASVGDVGKVLRFICEGFSANQIITLTSDWQVISRIGVATVANVTLLIETRGTHTQQTANAFVWGAQLEEGTTATAYQKTEASPTAGAKLPAMPYINSNDDSRSQSFSVNNDIDLTITGYKTTATTNHIIDTAYDSDESIHTWLLEQTSGKAKLTVYGQDSGETEPSVTITSTISINDGAKHDIRRTFVDGLVTLLVDNVTQGSASIVGATEIMSESGGFSYNTTLYLGVVPGYTTGYFVCDSVYGNGVLFEKTDVLGNPITNPSGNFHNGAETKLRVPEAPALRQADNSSFLYTGSTPNDIAYSDIVANIGDQIFADTSIDNEKKNIMVYDQVLVNPGLKKVEKFTNQ